MRGQNTRRFPTRPPAPLAPPAPGLRHDDRVWTAASIAELIAVAAAIALVKRHYFRDRNASRWQILLLRGLQPAAADTSASTGGRTVPSIPFVQPVRSSGSSAFQPHRLRPGAELHADVRRRRGSVSVIDDLVVLLLRGIVGGQLSALVGLVRLRPRLRHGRRKRARLPGHLLGTAAAERHQLLPHVARHHRSDGRRSGHADGYSRIGAR